MELDKKYSLVRLIINAGLEEDFMKWLEAKGYRDLYGRLDNIPSNLVEEYVNKKKLLVIEEDRDLLTEINNIDYEDEHGKGYIRAKKS